MEMGRGNEFDRRRFIKGALGASGALVVGSQLGRIRPAEAHLPLPLPILPDPGNYTSCDNYFCSILAETYPNRFFMHSAQTDRLHNSFTEATIPTIWDRLNQLGGPTGRYYFSDVPFVALWGPAYIDIARPFEK